MAAAAIPARPHEQPHVDQGTLSISGVEDESHDERNPHPTTLVTATQRPPARLPDNVDATPYTKSTSPGERSKNPLRSSSCCACDACAWRNLVASSSAAPPTGTFTKKIQRQDSMSTK